MDMNDAVDARIEKYLIKECDFASRDDVVEHVAGAVKIVNDLSCFNSQRIDNVVKGNVLEHKLIEARIDDVEKKVCDKLREINKQNSNRWLRYTVEFAIISAIVAVYVWLI